MSTFGIICELNPMHTGHKYLFDCARKLGADRLVCLMSGNATQRGELAVFDKYTRAEAALASGADLVLELPFPWCASSAEKFASAGVKLLSPICGTLLFGSECGDIELLYSAAELASSDNFKADYTSLCKEGIGAAEAYIQLLEEHGFKQLASNDLLAIEYIKAGILQNSRMTFKTVKREGSAFLCEQLTEGAFPSASAIRRAWYEGTFESTADYIPKEAFEIYKRAMLEGKMTEDGEISKAILLSLRLKSEQELCEIAYADGGVANRILSLAHSVYTLDELYAKLSTKRYTDARLRRAVMFCLLGIKKELIEGLPVYTQLLACNGKGRAILAGCRKNNDVNIVTKPADAPRDSGQFAAERTLDALFSLARKKRILPSEALKKNAFVLD